MRPENKTVFYLTLIPAPWFCLDFLPTWFPPSLTIFFLIRIFFHFNTLILISASILGSYLALKEFGKRLTPEAAVSILNIMLASKLGQKCVNFKTHATLGLLWIGSLALFNNSIYYLLYLLAAATIISLMLKSAPDEKFKMNLNPSLSGLVPILKSLPLILILFFAFPRFRGFLPSANQQNQQSGYSKSVSNSDASNLNLSDKVAFYAETGKKINPELLYWRGRTHEATDGYNWRKASVRHSSIPVHNSPNELLTYTMKYESDFSGDIILLDHPIQILDSNLRHIRNEQSNTFKNFRDGKKFQVKASSHPMANLRSNIEGVKGKYLALPGFLPSSFKNMFKTTSKSPRDLINDFKNSLTRNGFKYSLSPGPMPTLSEFIENKSGFCGHFASLLGIYLRSNSVPSRLVSGFQGGTYNPSGGFYTIRNKDAHVWVEYHDGESWRRVDPTSFVSPERITLGVQGLGGQQASKSTGIFSQGLLEAQAWIENLNFRLALFFDNYNREAQEILAKDFSLTLKDFYRISFALLVLTITFLFFSFRHKNKGMSKEDILFKRFEKKLLKKGLSITKDMSELEIIELCKKEGLPSSYEDFLTSYRQIKYMNQRADKEIINKFKSL